MKQYIDKLCTLWLIKNYLNDLQLYKAVKYIDKSFPELNNLDKKKLKQIKKLPNIDFILNNFNINQKLNQENNQESEKKIKTFDKVIKNINKKIKVNTKMKNCEIESNFNDNIIDNNTIDNDINVNDNSIISNNDDNNLDDNNNNNNNNNNNQDNFKSSEIICDSIKNRFRRIDEDKYKDKLLDDRFKDNSYWNMKKYSNEADDFASKAAYELGQVRGKGFRQEKAKKKRCSWKGNGTISTGISSIQFSDSD